MIHPELKLKYLILYLRQRRQSRGPKRRLSQIGKIMLNQIKEWMLFLVNMEDFGLHSVMNKKEQPAMTEVGMVKQNAMPRSGIVEQQAMPGVGMMEQQVARKVQTPMLGCLALTETVLNLLVHIL